MADTNHAHSESIPVQADGVSFRAVFWSVVVMALTVVISQVLMVGAFKFLESQTAEGDTPRSPLAALQGTHPPQPNLLYQGTDTAESNEPGYLAKFRAAETAKLHGYAFDKGAGVGRLLIDRAKALLLEDGLAVRGAAAAAAAPAAAHATTAPAKGEP